MKSFIPGEIRDYLRAVDRRLQEPFQLVIIGGAAAALSLDPHKATVDIDTANKVDAIRGACEAARADTGLRIPLAFATAYEAPRLFESRLTALSLSGLKKLRILVPEKHDWALMKMARLTAKDIADVKAVARTRGLSKETLLERFRAEMSGGGRPTDRLATHFLALVEELWGPAEADRMERTLRGR